MGWRDRPYASDDSGPAMAGGMQFALPPWTPIVKRLILANAVAALATIVLNWRPWLVPDALNVGSANALYALGGLDVHLSITRGQVWRLFTYQYLHGGPFHLLFNMLGLYFLGPPLERQFGRRTFFLFYTICGVAAGVIYVVAAVVLAAMNLPTGPFIIGASGSVLGVLAGCAILFPRMIIILLFFPVPIRVAATLFVVVYVLTILWDGDLSNAAHLGGMIAAWGWIQVGRRHEARMLGGGAGGDPVSRVRKSAGSWQRKQRKLQKEAAEVDRILAKVHDRGIGSLSWWEKRTLKKATERQKERDRQAEQRLRDWNVH